MRICARKEFLCSENTSGGVLSSIRSEYVMIIIHDPA